MGPTSGWCFLFSCHSESSISESSNRKKKSIVTFHEYSKCKRSDQHADEFVCFFLELAQYKCTPEQTAPLTSKHLIEVAKLGAEMAADSSTANWSFSLCSRRRPSFRAVTNSED